MIELAEDARKLPAINVPVVLREWVGKLRTAF